MSKKVRNPVHRASVEINKPKTFRNRKKDYTRKQKYEGFEHEEPFHQPYSRNGKQNKNTRFKDDYDEEELREEDEQEPEQGE